jgi:hypothetical protein
LSCLTAGAAVSQDCTLVVEGTGWLWQAEPAPAGWTELGHDDDPETSDWQVGCAPFSSNGCGFAPGTYWTPGTNLVLRQHVFLNGSETGFTANIAIDNDFELYVNGSLVGSLVHEGCATRWDARLPVPDALWLPGDNVIAVHAVDRGGITNFEMTLTATAPEGCPPGCAQLSCAEPGPALVVPAWDACPGQVVAVRAEASLDPRCPTDFEYRFVDGGGAVLRAWGEPDWWAIMGVDGVDVSAQVRCGYSPTCPIGSAAASHAIVAGPPSDPGPVLRVSKSAPGLLVDWSLAPELAAGDHEHLWASDAADGGWALRAPEDHLGSSWSGIDAGPLRYYRLRRADDCERQSPLR